MTDPRLRKNIIKHLSASSAGRAILIPALYLYQAINSIFRMNTSKNSLNAEKVISHKHKFIYIAVPKVATRSILDILVRDPPVSLDATLTEKKISRIIQENPEFLEYTLFTVVRNPWSRVVSSYRDKIERLDAITNARIVSRYSGLRQGMPFEEYVHWLCGPNGGDDLADRHWLSQYKFLLDENNKVLPVRVLKFESLQADFNRLMEEIGLPSLVLPHRLKTGSSDSWKLYYNSELYDLIADRYATDLSLFGYDTGS